MQGKANVNGHPIHLMLVSFPVAFWSGALMTDAIGTFARDPFWFRMSVVLLAMGTIGAVLASIFGFIDYRTAAMSPRARRVANWHLAGSLVATAVFAGAYLLRAHDWVSRLGIALTLLGALALGVGGYFGSELSNRFRVGVMERPRRAGPL